MSRLADGATTAALVLCALAVAVLAYGLATRAFVPRTTPTREAGRAADSSDRVQVEVWNAAGVDGLAAAAAERLRRRGFDVVTTGNAGRRDTSAVVVRSGTTLDARHVAQALGLSEALVVTGGPTEDYTLDVTVYLATDLPDRPFD